MLLHSMQPSGAKCREVRLHNVCGDQSEIRKPVGSVLVERAAKLSVLVGWGVQVRECEVHSLSELSHLIDVRMVR